MSTAQQRLTAAAVAWRRADLALAPEDKPSHLPWIVAIMAFVAGLALSVALALSGMAGRWSADLTGVLTVEIAAESASDPRSPDERLDAVLAVLRATPGVASATPVPNERLAAMVEPWLGKAAVSGELPLPRIIDVHLDVPGIDLPALAARLAAAAADTTVDDHRRWLGGLLRFARNAVTVALALVALVSLAASGTVAFATRAGLAAHHEAIELLHLMGAHDSYIARQFARLVLLRSAFGAAAGIVVAVLVFYGLAFSAQTNVTLGEAPAMLAGPLLGLWDFALLAALPAAIVAVATVTAWWTVIRALRGMV